MCNKNVIFKDSVYFFNTSRNINRTIAIDNSWFFQELRFSRWRDWSICFRHKVLFFIFIRAGVKQQSWIWNSNSSLRNKVSISLDITKKKPSNCATRCHLFPHHPVATKRTRVIASEVQNTSGHRSVPLHPIPVSAITDRGRRNDAAAIAAESPAPAWIANWGRAGEDAAAGVCWPSADRVRTWDWPRWGVRTVARSSRRGVVVARATAAPNTGSRG